MIRLDHLSKTCQTLLIPLTGRAYGEKLFPELGFRDLKAAEFADRIDYDREVFIGDPRAVWGTLLRTQVFDRLTQEFIDANPDGVVVNLGAGLCTRYFRLQTRNVTWLELDLPEVIALKARLCAATDRYRLMPFDLGSDAAWAEIAPLLTGKPTLVVAEGVLMFLEHAGVDLVFRKFLAMQAPSLRFAFDYLHPWVKRYRWLQPRSFRATGASYVWAGGSLAGLLAAHPRLHLMTARELSARFPLRLRVLNGALKALAGSSLYDIAIVDQRD